MSTLPNDSLEVKHPQQQAHRLNLYLTPSVYAAIAGIVEEHGFKSPSEVVQQGLRMLLLAHKLETDPDEGLYWKKGDTYSRVKLI